eukprot:10358679-Prorocentrum_lima.AAC.1
MMKGLINMMKQQLRHIKEPPPTRKELVVQQDDQQIRREELYLSKSSHKAVENSLRHGISNLASGGLESVPVSGKEVADSKGEALIEWLASIN